MNDYARAALTLAAILLALPLIQFISVVVQLLRVPISPARFVRGEPPDPKTPDQRAAIAEIEALGFRPVDAGIVNQGPQARGVVFYRHETQPALALLSLKPFLYAAYPVVFYSLDSSGRMLSTCNRSLWLSPDRQENEIPVDARADNLAAHWQAHCDRIRGLPEVSAERALQERVEASINDFYASLQRNGTIREFGDIAHLRLLGALRCATEWVKVRRTLARPYVAAASSPENQSAFFARCYVEVEAQRDRLAPRRDVKTWLLTLTVLASLLLWGWYVGWEQALALVAIIAIHEGGHALAMRAFGYRDLSMFFIPFVGAVVTGNARQMAAWKQVLVLLAGPLPGLFIGVAAMVYLLDRPELSAGFDWRLTATMAVAINLFNLLPFTPLDGGQVLDTVLFRRWTSARLAFFGLSLAAFLALAWWLQAPALWVLVALMAWSMTTQWRIASLERTWSNGLDAREQIAHLFEHARRHFRAQGFLRQYPLVRAVFAARRIEAPRLWETSLALLVLLPLWGGLATLSYELWAPPRGSAAARDARSPAQVAFDAAYDEDHDADESRRLAKLVRLATDLGPDDPRQVDIAVSRAWAGPVAERKAALESLVQRGRPGRLTTIASLKESVLDDTFSEQIGAPPLVLAQVMQAAVERLDQLDPAHALEGTILARLRIAEAIDQSGDSDRAFRMLTELRETAEKREDCRCNVASIIRAQAWYLMSHRRSDAAIALLEDHLGAGKMKADRRRLQIDLAWAQLSAGELAKGKETMRASAYNTPRQPSLAQRLLGSSPVAPRLVAPVDLAHALLLSGETEAARKLFDPKNQWQCELALAAPRFEVPEPWQSTRQSALRETAEQLCAEH